MAEEYLFKYKNAEDEIKNVFRILVSWDLFDLEYSENCNADYLEVIHQILLLHFVSNIPIVSINIKDFNTADIYCCSLPFR